jgi:hypothetical protein
MLDLIGKIIARGRQETSAASVRAAMSDSAAVIAFVQPRCGVGDEDVRNRSHAGIIVQHRNAQHDVRVFQPFGQYMAATARTKPPVASGRRFKGTQSLLPGTPPKVRPHHPRSRGKRGCVGPTTSHAMTMADRRVVLFMRRLPIDEIICVSGRGPFATSRLTRRMSAHWGQHLRPIVAHFTRRPVKKC